MEKLCLSFVASLRRVKGFTLVELLIVVAIIGVLSTVGVPTFRRMVQKAKQTEAKTKLGAVYKGETAFFAEYDTYANRLDRIGIELENSNGSCMSSEDIYAFGFFTNLPECIPMIGPEPSTGTRYTHLMKVYPSYYSAGGAPVYASCSTELPKCPVDPGGQMPVVPTDGSTFAAQANGLISPKYQPNPFNPVEAFDAWMINDQRALTNIQSGIH